MSYLFFYVPLLEWSWKIFLSFRPFLSDGFELKLRWQRNNVIGSITWLNFSTTILSFCFSRNPKSWFAVIVGVLKLFVFVVAVVDFTIIWTNWPSSFLQANKNNNNNNHRGGGCDTTKSLFDKIYGFHCFRSLNSLSLSLLLFKRSSFWEYSIERSPFSVFPNKSTVRL